MKRGIFCSGNSTVPSLFFGGMVPTSRQLAISGYQNITFDGTILSFFLSFFLFFFLKSLLQDLFFFFPLLHVKLLFLKSHTSFYGGKTPYSYPIFFYNNYPYPIIKKKIIFARSFFFLSFMLIWFKKIYILLFFFFYLSWSKKDCKRKSLHVFLRITSY